MFLDKNDDFISDEGSEFISLNEFNAILEAYTCVDKRDQEKFNTIFNDPNKSRAVLSVINKCKKFGFK